MEDLKVIVAATDLGCHVNGSDIGAKELYKELINRKIISPNKTIFLEKNPITKSLDKKDMTKNIKEINIFNNELFLNASSSNDFIMTIGGDHSIGTATTLASQKKKDTTVIWIDAHTDFNLISTTITGNVHGLPLAASAGLVKEMTPFTDNFIKKENIYILGARSIDKKEKEVLDLNKIKYYNLKESTISLLKEILNSHENIHVSFDFDVLDPTIMTGVSIPEKGGMDVKTGQEFLVEIAKSPNVSSIDFVEYNKLTDRDGESLEIAVLLIDTYIKNKEKDTK